MAEENAHQVTITVRDNGSYRITGAFRLLDGDGSEMDFPASDREWVSLCRCGHSSTKPFCDGTHKTVEFDSVIRLSDLISNPD
jgi:CDGSH iron-sulfur domain-containing protein 3